jgi:hypothetical protein
LPIWTSEQLAVTKLLSGINLQIYFARLGSAVLGHLEQEYLAMMPPGIRVSTLRYKRWQDRQATLFGKLLLLKALRIEFPDTGMQKFQSLGVTRDGKPFIPGGPNSIFPIQETWWYWQSSKMGPWESISRKFALSV